ncbi:MAG: protein kinase [Bryobacterales bacterium]|nr:protein kinase [Bryobacterales bacterium]
MIGRTISHYRILRRIGAGGMGVVYEAEDTRLHRTVALKMLPEGALEREQKSRFVQEARAAAQLHHPNICPIYDVGEEEGRLFFTMAYLEGRPLSDLIHGQPLPVSVALDIAVQLSAGLSQAHRRGIVHRDIKPQNVVIGEGGHASILDFGLALMDGGSRNTDPGRVVGTAAYMSPEQVDGGEVGPRSDIWSVALVLYEMLTGLRPFQRSTPVATLRAVLDEEPRPVDSLRPEIPQALSAVIARGLQKQPEARWQSAAELETELRGIRKQLSPDGDDPAALLAAAMALAPKASNRLEGAETRTQTADGVESWTPRAATLARSPRSQMARRAMVLVAAFSLMVVAALWWAFVREGAPGAVATLPEAKTVAILPFEVFGEDASLQALSDGLADTLTAELSQLERFHGKLMVVPASEIRADEIRSAEDARNRYAANLVVTGSTQRMGDQVQLTLSLVDSKRLRQLGARTFHFDIKNPASLRTGAITRLASLLEIPFGAEQASVVETGSTERGVAQIAYLEGRGLLARYDQQGNIDGAIDRFQAAIGQDPNYALACAGLAEAYFRKAVNTSDSQWLALAAESAQRAAALAPRLPMAYVVLGEINVYQGRHQQAIQQFEEALRIAPGSAEARRGIAEVHTAEGRFGEAERAYQEAIRQRPQDWFGHLLLGYFYIQRSDYAKAEQALRAALELTPDNAIVHRNLAVVFMSLGRYQEARQQLEVALRLRPNATTYGTLGVAYYYEGRYAEAASALETAIDLDANDYIQWGNLGTAYRWAPDGEAKARAAFLRAIELGEAMLRVSPKAHRVRANLAEYYAKLGEREEARRRVSEIPEAVRENYAVRIALVYELAGERTAAVRMLRPLVKDVSVQNDVRYDPDLAGLWKDPVFAQLVREANGKTGNSE